MATNLESYKVRSEMDKVKAAIVKHLPQFQGLVEELNALNPKNNVLINNLIEKWKRREPPSENVRDIIKNNIDHNNEADRRQDREARGIEPDEYFNEKRWILKEQNAWYGWDPRANDYGARPIEYGGDLDYDKIFDKQVISYQVSGTINLYRTMTRFSKVKSF